MTADQMTLVFAARDEALQAVTDHSDAQDIAVVDQAILTVAQQGRPFSANDFRGLLPELRNRKLIGARINSLRMRKVLRKVDEVTSTDVGTHGKKVGVYVLQRVSDCDVVSSDTVGD